MRAGTVCQADDSPKSSYCIWTCAVHEKTYLLRMLMCTQCSAAGQSLNVAPDLSHLMCDFENTKLHVLDGPLSSRVSNCHLACSLERFEVQVACCVGLAF